MYVVRLLTSVCPLGASQPLLKVAKAANEREQWFSVIESESIANKIAIKFYYSTWLVEF